MFCILPQIPDPEFFVTRLTERAQTKEFDEILQECITANVAVRDAVNWWNRSKTLCRDLPFDLFPEDEFDIRGFYLALSRALYAVKNFDVIMAVVFQRLSAASITEEQTEVIRAFVASPKFKEGALRAQQAKEWATKAVPKEYNFTASKSHDGLLRPLLQDYPPSKQ